MANFRKLIMRVKKTHNGFTLIELLIYTAIVVILVPLMYSSLAHFLRVLSLSMQAQQQLMRESLVLDIVRRDMYGFDEAIMLDGVWAFNLKEIQSDRHKDCFWISWGVNSKGVFRKKGIVDTVHVRWLSSNIQYFPGAMTQLTCCPEFNTRTNKPLGSLIKYQSNGQEKTMRMLIRSSRWHNVN